MTTRPTIEYQKYTKLKINTYHRPDCVGEVIDIETPHAGLITFQTSEIKGFFSPKEQPKMIERILGKIVGIEETAKNFLLNKWLNEK